MLNTEDTDILQTSSTLTDVGVSCSNHKSGECLGSVIHFCVLSPDFFHFQEEYVQKFDTIKPVTLQSRPETLLCELVILFLLLFLCVIPCCSVHLGPVRVDRL